MVRAVSSDDLRDLFTEEKEAFAVYERLCARYQTTPDPIAIAASKARLDLLNELMTNNTEPQTKRRITDLLSKQTRK